MTAAHDARSRLSSGRASRPRPRRRHQSNADSVERRLGPLCMPSLASTLLTALTVPPPIPSRTAISLFASPARPGADVFAVGRGSFVSVTRISPQSRGGLRRQNTRPAARRGSLLSSSPRMSSRGSQLRRHEWRRPPCHHRARWWHRTTPGASRRIAAVAACRPCLASAGPSRPHLAATPSPADCRLAVLGLGDDFEVRIAGEEHQSLANNPWSSSGSIVWALSLFRHNSVASRVARPRISTSVVPSAVSVQHRRVRP